MDEQQSGQFELNAVDWKKILKGAGISLLGALGTYLLTISGTINFGQNTVFIAAGLSIIANMTLKWANDNTR